MNGTACESVREWIPDLAAGRLDAGVAAAVELHLVACEDCRAERDLVALLLAGRPAAPVGVVDAVEASLRTRRGGGTRPWWALAAASVAAVGLGIGIMSDARPPLPEIPAYAAVTGESFGWLGEEGFVAGAPALGDLSEEALLTLLEEMTVTPSGGAA